MSEPGELKARKRVIATARSPWMIVAAVLILAALFLRIALHYGSPNVHMSDEVHQYLEQGHRLIHGYGTIPWEYRDGSRSWTLPGAIAACMWIGESVGGSHMAGLFAVHLTMAGVSLAAVIVGLLYGYRCAGWLGAIVTGALCAFWFELVYFGPKTLTEVVAAHVLIVALYLAYPGAPAENKRRLFIAGVLLGLTFILRLHLAPAIAVIAVWVCAKRWRTRWLPMALGGLIVLLLAGLLDALTWPYPFQSFWINVKRNLFEGKAASFGVDPWYWYIGIVGLTWLYMAIPFAFCFVLGMRRLPLLGVTAIVIVLVHMCIGHKEYRFIYPAIVPAMITIGVGASLALAWARDRWHWSGVQAAAVAATCIALILLGGWQRSQTPRYQRHWRSQRGMLLAFDAIRYDAPQAIALHGVKWGHTPGYAYLHHDVPIVILDQPGQVRASAGHYSHLVTGTRLEDADDILVPMGDWGQGHQDETRIYLYRAVVPYKGDPPVTLNQQLIERGE